MKMCSALLASAFVVACVASYPSTYPFENEAFVPVPIPDGTPSDVLDEKDPVNYTVDDVGGYVPYYAINLGLYDGTITEEDLPYSLAMNGFIRWCLVNVYGAPPVLPKTTWNCTARGHPALASSDYTGQIGGNTVCEPGECCEYLMGKVKGTDDQLDWHQWLDDRSSAALCGAVPEEAYCTMVGGDFHMQCLEYYPSPVERLAVFPCYDTYVLYYLSCSVFKQAYTVVTEKEPDTYKNSLTNEELLTHDSFSFLQDRICHPHSYFKGATAESSASGSSATDTSTSSSTGYHHNVGLFLALTTLVVFLQV